MVVQTSTSCCLSQKSNTTFSSDPSAICPCATAARASGTGRIAGPPFARCAPPVVHVGHLAPPAGPPDGFTTAASSTSPTYVRMGFSAAGGVLMNERSRIPVRAISSVRGMGLADRVGTSCPRSWPSAPPCARPRRCSSSTTRSPRSLKATSPEGAGGCRSPRPPSRRASGRHGKAWAVVRKQSIPKRPGARREPFLERLGVPRGQQRGGDEDGGLLPVLDRLEHGSHGDLGLAESPRPPTPGGPWVQAPPCPPSPPRWPEPGRGSPCRDRPPAGAATGCRVRRHGRDLEPTAV